MPLLERQGAHIAYDVSGPEGAEPAPPPIVLGHSLLCDTRMWEGVAPVLARRRRVLNVEFRGHRRSTAPGRFQLEDLADDWRAILDAERIDRAILCGLSMGGMTALRLALASPDRVAALVLLDSSGDPEPAWALVKYRAMAEAVRRIGYLRPIDRAVADVMFGPATLAHEQALVDRLVERIHEHDPRQIYFAVRAVIDRGDLHDRLAAIACPTLILVGEDDRATPPERSVRLAAAIPGAVMKVIPRAGHLSALERPDAVAAAITGFLDALPG
jgi:pimeloyl-ACP methyl ester carboxylesterase